MKWTEKDAAQAVIGLQHTVLTGGASTRVSAAHHPTFRRRGMPRQRAIVIESSHYCDAAVIFAEYDDADKHPRGAAIE